MEGDVSGVRVTPPVLEFFDTEVNVLYQLNITVKNVSQNSRSIRYYGPKSKNFCLKVKNPDKPIAPGLCVPAVIEYETDDAKECRDRLVITVDGDVIEIPLFAYPSQPVLEIDRQVNFGNVVANSKVVAKEISLVNHGSKAGEFKIKYGGDKPLTVIPTSGSVPPKSVQRIKIEYVAKYPGKFMEEAMVKLEGQETKSIMIEGTVVERALELVSVHSNEIVDCIRFGSTYYGTDRTECALLYNNGPESVNFVALLDEDAIAQELGVDLSKTTIAALAEQSESGQKSKGNTNVLTSLITAIPNQGTLSPYEKIPIFFRFSPRWHSSKQGWKTQIEPAPRKDFAVFLRIQIIGSNYGFTHVPAQSEISNVEGSHVEVALTGTALPVLLSISPSATFDFGGCMVGNHTDVLCTIKNESSALPAAFKFRRVAHYTARPSKGKIMPGKMQDIIFSFAPNQVGTFDFQQLLDVIGHAADKTNPTTIASQVIYTLPIQFAGLSDPVTMLKDPKYNPGITPQITNEVGLYAETTFSSLKDDQPRNAVVSSTNNQLHTLKRSSTAGREVSTLVAFPNDRAQSIRSSDRKETYKTIFTKEQRHTYVDPDYEYTDDEEHARQKHVYRYQQIIRNMRESRINKLKSTEFNQTNNKVDLGMKSASGLLPKKLSSEEIHPDARTPSPPNAKWKLLSTKELVKSELEATIKPVKDGLNAIPVTFQEKTDCKKILNPQELHQVVVGPPTVDFSNVCLRSVNTKEMHIVNNLNQYIHIVAEVDCKELRQTSPLSQVVPPRSKAILPLMFESNTKGRFQRSVMYTINGFYKHHVTVLAEVIPVDLALSTMELVLSPTQGQPAESGYRGVITLANKLNHPAEFTWSPNLGERGTAFSIRPATGFVNAFSDLDCEVVWHPSFLAPEDGSFSLVVHGGHTKQLRCRAELGTSNIQFIERRIMFGQVPINLATTRKALLHNTGHNHAYFQVLDPNPFPGLTVSPIHGVVPVGGSAELKVQLLPDAVLKFDTRVQVEIRGGKTLELRMGGTVEPPAVDIDVADFNFGGVYCGSGATLPFKLINKTVTKAKMEFDLIRYKEFSLNFSGYQTQEDYNYQLLNPGMFSVSLQSQESIEGEVIFMPTEVAAYDFVMPVLINQMGAPTPAPTPFPPTPAPTNKNSLPHIINPRPISVTIVTPRRHVIATGLRQPLQLSTNRVEFSLPSSFLENSAVRDVGVSKVVEIINNSDKHIDWGLDLSQGSTALDDGVLKFVHPNGTPYLALRDGAKGIEGTLEPGKSHSVSVSFCPKEAGKYECVVPVVINGHYNKPYQYLQLVAELKSPSLSFEPRTIILTPVPLATEISASFTILAAQYRQTSDISVHLPEVECEDGSKMSPLSVSFASGRVINPCCGDEGQEEPFAIHCKLTFVSNKPVSFSENVKFTDADGRSFALMVSATADNCLLSCYPFLAQHRTDHQIVCEQGTILKGRKTISKESVNVGEAVFVPCHSSQHNSRPSTSATSSNFQISSSSYESSVSVTDTTDQMTPFARDGAMNKPPSDSERESRENHDPTVRSLGSALFPDEDSEEGIFFMEVLVAVQRWYSSQGWPGGPFPITIPESLRSGISRKVSDDQSKAAKAGSWDTSNLKKEFKTIYDMISHLSGRPVPGIPLNSPLPSDPVERVKQVYWQHSTLLTFLKCQGACLSSLKPEYLMEPRDYHLWRQLQQELHNEFGQKSITKETPSTADSDLDPDLFEVFSKRAWTDVLLQTLKTLMLARITPRTLKNTPSADRNLTLPDVNPDPLCSNIYSLSERIVLSWLNHHYESYRKRIWTGCKKGGIPPSRWIVNYDFDLLDGLVLGAVLGAHMPFLVESHLNDMYTQPATAEQCLHNALKVVNSMVYAGIDYDIQAIDITDPNPIALLMLCIHLYQRLPQYLPKSNIEFVGGLHKTVTRQVKLSNPSNKALVYQVLLVGRDARDFVVPKGDHVTVGPKSSLPLSIEFKSRFLRPAEAVLVLVGKRQGSTVGTTLTFNLRTQIDNITPKQIIKCESSCYDLDLLQLNIVNPFSEAGEFRIVLVESRQDLLDPSRPAATLLRHKHKRRKKIRSRVNHGQNRPETPPTPPPPQITDALDLATKTDDSQKLSAFYCPLTSIELDAHGTTTVDIHFLPFSVGEHQCSVIFLNEAIGEFLFSIEAEAKLPIPSVLPFVSSPHSLRISSAAAAGSGRGLFGGDERVIYWKCEVGQTLAETLMVPVSNMAKERALLLAAQQHMSSTELQRRKITGTLNSCSVTAKTVSHLSSNTRAMPKEANYPNPKGVTFSIELDSKFFTAPETLDIPQPEIARAYSAPANTRVPKGVVLDDGVVELPISFKTTEPGHYPCMLTLRSPDDVRSYMIECTANPVGSNAELDFTSPVHHTVTQEIPIVNLTNTDWPLVSSVEGDGFTGPVNLLAKAFQTTKYPLTFKPLYEGNIEGKLILTNKEDATQHTFQLSGCGEKPLALETIKVKCEAKKSITQVLKVPNATNKKLIYKVESDLPFIVGNPYISVLSGQSRSYEMVISPTRRGLYRGVIAFVAGGNPNPDVDSDGDEIPGADDQGNEYDGYRMWYAAEVKVTPPPPERTLEIKCACQKKAVMEVMVRNPTDQNLVLEAVIEGHGLTGVESISLLAGQKGVYLLTFTPFAVGKSKGSLIFFNRAVGEFWYDLQLVAESPAPTTLPHMECELGRWTKQDIVLWNNSDQSLELVSTLSNTNNFTIERDNDQPITLRPHSHILVPLHFMPSTLGHGDHFGKIVFHSQQLGEWVFVASGTGFLPQPQDPVSVFTTAGSNTTLLIPFRNPLDVPVIVDILLTDKDQQMDKITNKSDGMASPFCLLLKHNSDIRVGPKSTLDIPVSFAPVEMRMYEALCTVVVQQENEEKWVYSPSIEDQRATIQDPDTQELSEIRWLFPIHGIPECKPVKDSQAAVLDCQARERIEQRLEVTLSGVAPNTSGSRRGMRTRNKTPLTEEPRQPDGVIVGEGTLVADEFTFDLVFPNNEAEQDLLQSVALSLVRQYREPASGLIVLVFNIVFAPFKMMLHDVQLQVTAATGGMWKFPVKFTASEPQVDDTLLIEASGLGKPSSVGFRLNSLTRHPALFNAYLTSGSDPEFTVTPQTGELLPEGSNGTLISVNFLPQVYGKLYQAKLVVQTPDMQWSYNVRGVLPEYMPPRGRSSRPMAGPHPDPRNRNEKMNYIKNNMNLITTAVSSPIKGAPIIQRLKNI